MHDHSSPSPAAPQTGSYMEEASAQDQILRDKLTVIRRREEASDITTRQAADMRIQVMEHHLAVTRALRVEYFGG